jgi:hypothetical protein
MLDLLNPEILPMLASQALDLGLETEAVVQLAGVNPSDHTQARTLFARILRENNPSDLSTIDALRLYADLISRTIIEGRIAAIAGARLIWAAVRQAGIDGFHDLDPFVYAASEAQDRPADEEFFADAVRKEATNRVKIPTDE